MALQQQPQRKQIYTRRAKTRCRGWSVGRIGDDFMMIYIVEQDIKLIFIYVSLATMINMALCISLFFFFLNLVSVLFLDVFLPETTHPLIKIIKDILDDIVCRLWKNITR